MFINGLLWYFLLVFSETDETMAEVSTACYGSPGIGSCAEHKLICTEQLVVSITNITFRYRQGSCATGVSSCVDISIACCREETGDCFTPFNKTLLTQLQQTCNAGRNCALNSKNGLSEASSLCSFNTRHSYSKIEYHCVTDTTGTTSPSLSPKTTAGTALPKTKLTSDQTSMSLINTHDSPTGRTTTDTDVGGIVGGIVGVILVIGIVGAAIYFIKRRKADKIPPKDIAINPDGSNRQYQTDTTIPRTTATPVYYELEKSTNNTSRPASARPISGDNYDYLGGDNHVKHATGNDNYNHIGISDVTSDDEYHHLKGTNSNTPSVPDSNYNQIGSFSTAEDNYQHIGDNKTRIITDDTYNHIGGHDNTGLDSDDYHHIGGSHEHQVVTDGTYNHIGGDHNEILGNDDYHHIGNRNTQPIITDGEYSHIGGADMNGEYLLDD